MTHKASPISIAILEQIKAQLTQLPDKPKAYVTRQEAVKQLEHEIRQAIAERGYSLTDIAKIFTTAGAPVQADTIGNALRNLQPKPSRKGLKPKPPPRADLPHRSPVSTATAMAVLATVPPAVPAPQIAQRQPTPSPAPQVQAVSPPPATPAMDNEEDHDGA